MEACILNHYHFQGLKSEGFFQQIKQLSTFLWSNSLNYLPHKFGRKK